MHIYLSKSWGCKCSSWHSEFIALPLQLKIKTKTKKVTLIGRGTAQLVKYLIYEHENLYWIPGTQSRMCRVSLQCPHWRKQKQGNPRALLACQSANGQA